MEKIASFTIDHTKLKRGIYVSRKDRIGEYVVTTFDIRMKVPNREPALSNEAIHTIEHLAATYLRNHSQWKDKIVYWGPMGCLTGNYLIVSGDYTSADILPLMIETFRFIVGYEGEIPGTTESECGNYKLHSLEEAKKESKIYLEEVLLSDDCGLEYDGNTHQPNLDSKRTLRLCTCNNSYDANMLKQALLSEGIECLTGNENMSNLFGGLISAFSGVDVFVFADELTKAKEIYSRLYGENV